VGQEGCEMRRVKGSSRQQEGQKEGGRASKGGGVCLGQI
jgi:hypothetical protein